MQSDFSDWLRALKANDDKTLKTLYHDNYPKIEKYILTNSGNKEQAKDIFQETFIICWRAVQDNKFIPENETSIGGYLYKIAKYKWLDYLRSSHHKKVVPITDSHEDWELPIDRKEEQENMLMIRNNFKKIGDSCREILTRFYFNKQSMKEIATANNWTEATARNNKYRCIQRLKELMNRN